MLKSEILPEICYEYNSLSFKDVFNAYVKNESVTGHVEKLLPDEEKVVVRLGDNITAYMPYSETTMYPLRYSAKVQSSIPKNIFFLVGQKIRVKVTSVSGTIVTVSRKDNMLAAFEHLCKCKRATFHVSSLEPKYAYGDIGDGIIGRIVIEEVSRTHIKSVKEYLSKSDIVEVSIINHNDDNYFNASYKQACKPYNKADYTVGMTVTGKICDPLSGAKTPGFYVSINPQVSGIINLKAGQPIFKYGTKVECIVTGASDNGLHLKFSKVI